MPANINMDSSLPSCSTSESVGPPVPEVDPPLDSPGRYTNQLKYILYNVMDTIDKIRDSASFKEPVDPVKLGITNYFEYITKPMDLGTIRKRIRKKYYFSSKECLADFHQMFANAYVYNRPGTKPVESARKVELALIRKLIDMPEEEEEIDILVGGRVSIVPEQFALEVGAGSRSRSEASPHSLRPRRRYSSGSLGNSSTPLMNDTSSSSSGSSSDTSTGSSSDSSDEENDPDMKGKVISAEKLKKWKINQIAILNNQMSLLQRQIETVRNMDASVMTLAKLRKSRKRKRKMVKKTPRPAQAAVPKKKCVRNLRNDMDPATCKKSPDTVDVAVVNGVGATKSQPVGTPTTSQKAADQRPTKIKPAEVDMSKPMTAEEILLLKIDIQSLEAENYDDVMTSLGHGDTLDLEEEEEDPLRRLEELPVKDQWNLRRIVTENLKNSVRTGKTRTARVIRTARSPCHHQAIVSPPSSLGLSISPTPSPPTPRSPASTTPMQFSESAEPFSANETPQDQNDDDGEENDPTMEFY